MNLIFSLAMFTIILLFSLDSQTADAVNDGGIITPIDSLEPDTSRGQYNSLVHVDGDTYALAYTGDDSDGFITTFTISSDGVIDEIESLEHDDVLGQHNSLVQVNADTYALAYYGSIAFSGFIKTFTISSDGTTITEIDSLEHDDVLGQHNSLVHVDGDTYALAYAGDDSDGFIKTFTISSDGKISEIELLLEHDTDNGMYNSLVQVNADTYALAYYGSIAFSGFIKTFTISSDGTTITEIDSLEHDTDSGMYNSLVHVDGDTYALAYAGDDSDGFITTFTISSDGVIDEIESLEHDDVNGQYNSLVQVNADTYALAYSGDDRDGFIKTFTISSDGVITEIDSLEHDDVNGQYNSLVQVNADTYALAYTGDDSDGFIKTFTISESSTVSTSSGGGSANKHNTKPTFGIDPKTFFQLIEGGFSFNNVPTDITDNYWTSFEKQSIKVGESNTFEAKVFASQKLRVQEFLFGIPIVGEAHNAELGVEIHYDYSGDIEKVKVIQKTDIIDIDSIKIEKIKSKCRADSYDERCVTTQLQMIFLEPLKDSVMAIKAIDFKGRFNITYLNDGFDITGDSVNPMITMMIPGTEKYEGLIKITQIAKYSDVWVAVDGRAFELNEYGSSKLIYQTVEDKLETSKNLDRYHSEFADYKELQVDIAVKKLLEICPSCLKSFTDFDDSFGYPYYVQINKLDNLLVIQKMILEEERAQKIMNYLLDPVQYRK